MVSEELWGLLSSAGYFITRYGTNESFQMSVSGDRKVPLIPVDLLDDGTVAQSLHATYTDICWGAFLSWAYQRHQCSKVSYVFKCIVETICIIAITVASTWVALTSIRIWNQCSRKREIRRAAEVATLANEQLGGPQIKSSTLASLM